MASQTLGKSQLSSYSYRQVRAVLKEIGITIDGETHNDFTVLCPYHSNRDTPAMTVSTSKGTFYCFSPQCGETGPLIKLVMDVARLNEFAARRLILKHAANTADTFEADMERILAPEPEFKPFDQAMLSALERNTWGDDTAGLDYLHSRHFTDDTIKEFKLGYSSKMRMVTVPVASPSGIPIGFIGRSIEGKEFKNSYKLDKQSTLFNLHRARAYNTAYITEASFDAIRLWQAGFPGAVAIAGGNISDRQLYLLNMYFSRIVIFTDFDDKEKNKKQNCRRCMPLMACQGHNPGRDLGNRIAEALKTKDILWATYDHGIVYPHGAKDVGDLTDDEIRQCAKNATPNYVYQTLGLY